MVLVAALTGLSLLAVAPAASAAPQAVKSGGNELVVPLTASGTTGPNHDHRTILVTGSGLTVKYVQTTWFKVNRACNTRMHITFFDTNNRMYRQHNSALSTGCRLDNRWKITSGYPITAKPGRVCGTVSENGVKKPGACVNIY